MTVIVALLGAKALYLMFIWLASAIIGSWCSHRAGYGAKVGLASGLLLTFVGAAIWIVLYLVAPRQNSPRQVEGVVPRRRRPTRQVADS